MTCMVSNVIEWLEDLAPPALAEDWDRIGLQIGDPASAVDRVLLTLTVTPSVVEQAIQRGANLIVAHHPVLFRPVADIRWDRPAGSLLRRLLTAHISVYAAHTNYDAADRGTSHILASHLGLLSTVPLVQADHASDDAGGTGLGRIGSLSTPLQPQDFLKHICAVLGKRHVEHAGPLPSNVSRIAVMGGSGGSFIKQAAVAQVDAYITGDIGFHDALEAHDQGLWVIDAGHFATEQIIVPFWKQYLAERAEQAGLSLQAFVAEEEDPFEHFWFERGR